MNYAGVERTLCDVFWGAPAKKGTVLVDLISMRSHPKRENSGSRAGDMMAVLWVDITEAWLEVYQ